MLLMVNSFMVVVISNMKVINKTLSPEEYLEEINMYFQDKINNLKISGTWEIQLLVEMDSIYLL